ncbi:MAG: hypothetical protein ABFS46_10330 [Myxococcota bacterium]
MRRALDRALGPAVERVLRRFEQNVDPAEHRRLATRLAGSHAFQERPASLGVHDAESLGLRMDRVRDEASAAARLLHLGTLSPPATSPEGALDAELAGVQARFLEAGNDDPAARALCLVVLAGLRRGEVGIGAAHDVAWRTAMGIEPKRWFLRRGVVFGTSNLLRILLGSGTEHETYTAEVCERLLRHVEVRRDDALLLRSGPDQPFEARLERLRFTHALLDAAARFRDLRFLNAALKLSDRHHRELAGAPRGDLLGLHYAAGVARQEALLASLLP